MTPSSVKVQIFPESVPSTPSWFGEVTLIAHVFTQRGLLTAIVERVRFARARFGIYDTIDFVVVLLGYAVSGERTLEEFYERASAIRSGVHEPLRANRSAFSLSAQSVFGRT